MAGEWKLIDFDTVVEAGELCTPACTVRYASPEVAAAASRNERLRVTTAVDVWACGLVLYELFTGEALLDEEVDLAELACSHACVHVHACRSRGLTHLLDGQIDLAELARAPQKIIRKLEQVREAT